MPLTFDGRLIAETISGTTTYEHIYMGKVRLARVDVESGTTYFYHNDRLGTPLLMTRGADGTVVWEATYKPFGEATIHPMSGVSNHFRFPGQYYDAETGLHCNYHRYYDPQTGRYLSPDPIGLVGGMNLFVYVQNNPVNEVDPFGLARYFVFWKMKSVSAVVVPAGITKIEGTVVSTKRNRYGTYDAIDFEGVFYGAALGPLPLAGTLNNQEYFEDPCEEPDLSRIEGLSWYLAGTMALYKAGVSGGGY